MRGPKLPDELVPIVDAVVEVVFERLRTAASAKNVTNNVVGRGGTTLPTVPSEYRPLGAIIRLLHVFMFFLPSNLLFDGTVRKE